MDLGICVQIPDSLNIHHDEFVPRALKGEVAERVRSLPAHPVVHESRVRVVLHVLPVDEVLHVVQGGAGSLVELKNGHHEDVHLLGRIVPGEFNSDSF